MTHRLWLSALIALACLAPLASAQDTKPEGEALSLPLRDADAWAFEFDLDNNVAIHRLTGMACPFVLAEGYSLISITQAGAHGAPVQCTYRNPQNEGFTSLSINWALKPDTAQTGASRRLSISEGGRNFQPGDLKSQAFQIDFDGEPAADCHQLYLPFVSDQTPKHEKVVSCQFGKWNFVINQTAPLNDNSLDAIIAKTRTLQSQMASHLNACIAPVTQTSQSPVLTASEHDELLKGVLNAEIVLRNIGVERNLPRLSAEKCMLAYLNTDQAQLLIMRDKSPEAATPITLYEATLRGIRPRPIAWVKKIEQIKDINIEDDVYALYIQNTPGIEQIYKLYQGTPPNDAQTLEDILGVFGKKLSRIAYLEQGGDNSWTWHIPPAE